MVDRTLKSNYYYYYYHSGSIFSYRNTQDLFINPPTGAACILWPCRRSSLLTSAPSSGGLLVEASSPSPSPSSAVSRVSPACFCSQLSSAHTATQRQPYALCISAASYHLPTLQHKDSHILCELLQPLIICPHCNTKTAIYSVSFCSHLSSAHTATQRQPYTLCASAATYHLPTLQHKDSHIFCELLQPLIICPHCNTKTAIYSVFLQPLITCLHCNTKTAIYCVFLQPLIIGPHCNTKTQPYILCIFAATYLPTLQHKDSHILCVLLQPLIICPHCNTKTQLYTLCVFLQPLIICPHCNTKASHILCAVSLATFQLSFGNDVSVCVNMYCICMHQCVCVHACVCVHMFCKHSTFSENQNI